MSEPLTRLFPVPSLTRPLDGCYLEHHLQGVGTDQTPVVYTNFICSLDGRIAELDPATGRRRVPEAIANERDWRLYLELAAQADVLLTTARHLRAVAQGRNRELIDFAAGGHEDLRRWRAEAGLSPQPAVAALSMALDIPAETLVQRHPGPILVVTGRAAPVARVRELQAHGVQVLVAGDEQRVGGTELLRTLRQQGFRTIYSIAGPGVLRTLLDAEALDRLYLTVAQVLLGGATNDTLTGGPPLAPPPGFRLRELHYDPGTPAGAGQLFACFERVARDRQPSAAPGD